MLTVKSAADDTARFRCSGCGSVSNTRRSDLDVPLRDRSGIVALRYAMEDYLRESAWIQNDLLPAQWRRPGGTWQSLGAALVEQLARDGVDA